MVLVVLLLCFLLIREEYRKARKTNLKLKVVIVAYVEDRLKLKWMPLETADETSRGEIVQGEW